MREPGMAWAIVTTVPNSEAFVSEQIKRQLNLPHLLFRRRVRRVYRGRLIERLYAAYPRYLFVKPEHAYAIRDTFPRVTSVVGTPEGPWLTSDAEIEEQIARSEPTADGGLAFPVPSRTDPFRFNEPLIIIGTHMLAGRRAWYRHLIDDDHFLVQAEARIGLVQAQLELRDVVRYESPRKRRYRGGRRHRRRNIAH